LHVVLGQGGLTSETLPDFLQTHGVQTGQIRDVVPSLEDVFVRIVSRAQDARSAA
jgi:ABC-2 type transport system ATP-binding protein